MKRKSKAEKIRTLLAAGTPAKEIATRVRAPINTVYNVQWKLKNKKTAKKVGRPAKQAAITVTKPVKATPVCDILREELHNVESQIGRLQTIASYLTIRLRQSELNGE